MYLSRLFIKNYRSIKELNLTFQPGKNVIVGRNNSGKSNILRAIDLLLGENAPTYDKSENVTDNDFCLGNTSHPILIFCELKRLKDEKLNYDDIYSCYGFKIHSKVTEWENKKPKTREAIRHSIKEVSLIKDLTNLFAIDEDAAGFDTEYINPKLRNQNTFENQFENKFNFAFCFYAFKDGQGKIQKDIRFLYREDETKDWVFAFKASVRNELVKSAIIPSFRDPQNQLRITNYGWYGKLLKCCIDPSNQKLQAAFQQVKNASDEVFRNLQDKINHSKVQIAFPNTQVTFQFNPDTKQDVHKSALIYVNDGFNSQLQDKGAGIQSAIIIGLFDFYTREVNKAGGSSLLAIEEPELYLHPHGRRAISKRLDDFLEGGRNQVIITTHSSEFISTTQQNLNIIVVTKNSNDGTKAKNTEFKTVKEKQILLRSQNVEMFFADFVVLVEGADRFILDVFSKEMGKKLKIKNKEGADSIELGDNWLDAYNVSIINCGGKMELWKYAAKLREVSIPHIILADFDYLKSGLSELMTNLKFQQNENDSLNELKSKYLSGDKKFKSITDVEQSKKEFVLSFIKGLKESHGIFILNHDLEDYYTENGKRAVVGIDGKEQKIIQLLITYWENKEPINHYLKSDEFEDLLSLVLLKLGLMVSK